MLFILLYPVVLGLTYRGLQLDSRQQRSGAVLCLGTPFMHTRTQVKFSFGRRSLFSAAYGMSVYCTFTRPVKSTS